MKKFQSFLKTVLMFASLWLAAYPANLRAEDIDIYVDAAGTSGVPNVLFVIDNGANFSANAKIGCSAYAGTTEAPSLGTTTGSGILQCALVDAIKSLPDGVMNIGILVSNANNFANDVRSTSDPAYHEVCETGTGGCLIRKLTLISATSKTNLVAFIKSWKDTGQNSATNFNVKVNTAVPGAMMQEAWAYYHGKTGMSTKTYSPSLVNSGCQRNFVIYIANTEKGPANEDDSYDGPQGLTSAQVNATDAQKKPIKEKVKFNPATCGVTEHNYSDNQNDWSENWADEWTRLMYQQDGGTSTQEGLQNIVTYTIGITNDATCTPDYPALLSTSAKYGGGKYFKVSNASEMSTALLAALNEVQAVNSVFSSASLPVSVNAEGSYLNQIFLGMFRPDASGAPRWLGNLKQYQLVRNSTGQLVLGDAEGKPALSSGGTGFLAPDAVSFWTYKDTSTSPDSIGGFFINDPKGTPNHAFDRADGEVVEKGGIAQQLRKQNLTATFDGASGASGNPRKVYTFCPHGGTDTEPCQKDLRHADNDFSTNNTKISAASFGSALTVPVLSIVRTGTTAVVSTIGNHGFTDSSVVTIRNADQPEYNRTTSITVNNSTQFTVGGLPDYPTTPSTISYTITVPGTAGEFAISALSRSSSSTTGSAKETVTVTTAADHPYLVNQTVRISNVTPTQFNGNWVVTGVPASNKFTFSIPIYPVSPAVNTYQVVHAPYTRAVDSITVSGGTYTVATSSAHGFHAGQTVTISGIKGQYKDAYNKSHVVQSIPTDRTFTIAPPSGSPGNATTGSVTPSTAAQNAGLKRNGTTVGTTATASGLPDNWFANGDKVNITTAGTSPNESGYVVSDAVISCAAPCSSFTYSITASPPLEGTAFGSVSIPGAGSTATVDAGNITRSGTTGKVSGLPSDLFLSGSVVNISATSGSAPSSESAYVGNWQITCPVSSCTSFTFGPVTLTPTTPATGTNIQAYSGNTSPDKDLLIKWLRGQDNQGDEKGPGNGITVRPSVHGDVLHSRPLVINYGDSRGIVVFYGSNDGVYRAINGNQSASTNGVPAGGELWGLILPEHYQLINRYRSNSPELKFPSSLLPTAQPKDYFVDGPTGVYQKLNADGTINKAIIYLTMRRGGRLIYALDVTQPDAPKYLWHISHQTPGFAELGQTWSRPRLTLLQNHKTPDPTSTDTTPVPTPVLVFGGGYDPTQDSEPPKADTMGRGIFVINARDGSLIWSASKTCDSTAYPCTKVDAMKYATPMDITFVDRDLNGLTDKMYWGDLGGNMWRADVSDASVGNWKVSRVARLGCDTGECASGTTPRKFFFPPAVLSVRPAGSTDSYEALSIVSGDREHPLRSTNTSSSYYVQDKFFMVKDLGTTVGAPDGSPSTVDVTASDTDLFDATSTLYDGSRKGFYIKLLGANTADTKGEKGVNAPVAVNGQIFFSTNRPMPPTNTCTVNLGEAKAYAISPFTGGFATNVLAGGGLPPSAVTGLITITTTNPDGTTTTTQEKFCIGCGLSGSQVGGTNTAPCTSALENCNIGTTIPKNLKRTYWYKK